MKRYIAVCFSLALLFGVLHTSFAKCESPTFKGSLTKQHPCAPVAATVQSVTVQPMPAVSHVDIVVERTDLTEWASYPVDEVVADVALVVMPVAHAPPIARLQKA